MMKSCRKLLAMVLACALILSNVPATVYAAELPGAQSEATELPSLEQDREKETTDNQAEPEENGTPDNKSDKDAEDSVEQPEAQNPENPDKDAAKEESPEAGADKTGASEEAQETDSLTMETAATEKNLAVQAADGAVEAEEGSISVDELLAQLKNITGISGLNAVSARLKGSTTISLVSLTGKVTVPAGTYTIEQYVKVGVLKYEWQSTGKKITVRTYYQATFSVTGDDGRGGVSVNGTAVTAPVKCYYGSGEADTTFTVNPVIGYDVKGVSVAGTQLTADANGVYTLTGYEKAITVQVEYEASKGAEIVVTAPESGTITVNGKEADSHKVALGSKYTVKVTPAAGYAVTAVYVNDTAVEADQITYSNQEATVELTAPDAEETVQIRADLVKAELKLKENSDVPYHDGMATGATDALKERIFAAIVDVDGSVPAGLTAADVTIEYKAGATRFTWKALDYTPGTFEFTLHAFGKDRTSETIRIRYAGNAQYPALSAEKAINLVDDRIETTTEIKSGMTLKYNTKENMDAALKNLLLQYVVVTDPDGKAISTTAADFEYEYTRAVGEQTIKVTYKGTDVYKSSSAEGTITITKGDAKVTVKSQNITVGDPLDTPIFSCTPAEANVIGIIAGVKGDGSYYVAIDAKSITLNDLAGMEIPLIGDLSLQEAMMKIGITEVKLGDLANVVEKVGDLIKTVAPDTDISAIVDGIQTAVDLLTKLVPGIENMVISFDAEPKSAGIYTAVGVTVNGNYNTAIGAGIITIAPKTADMQLVFNQEMPGNQISVKKVDGFTFGGHLSEGSEEIANRDHVKTLYTGVTASGNPWVSDKPGMEAGSYVETVYVLGGDYFATPIMRAYQVTRETTYIQFEPENAEVETFYDGTHHTVAAGVYYDDPTNGATRICDATLIEYMAGDTYYSEEGPVNAGTYQVKASFAGNEEFKPVEAAYTRITIKPQTLKIKPVSCEKEYGDADPAYVPGDENGTPLDDETLGLLKNVTITRENTAEQIGSYPLTIQAESADPNYTLELQEGKLTIQPRQIVIQVDEKSKIQGDADPELTYTVSRTTAEGAGLVDGDELGVILSREQGETPGLYDIYVNVKEWNPNYELTNEPDGTDKFEVIEKIIVKPISCEKEYGDADPVYQIGDENGNPLSEETLSKLGTLTVVREDTSENAGTYELTVQAAEADGNFVLELQEGKLTIQPRKIELEIDQKTKKKGAKDPELTYTAVRTGTEDTAVVEGDDLGLVLSREQGEKVGFYDIYLDVSGWNTNYELTNAPDGTDKFEITAKKSGSNGGSHSGSSSGSTDVKATSPKTADTAHAEWYAGSMTLALVGIAAVLFYRRKRS